MLLGALSGAASGQANRPDEQRAAAARPAVAARRASAKPATYKRSMAAVPIGDVAGWFDPDSYPAEAMAANRQGRVVVQLGIDSTGAVVSCSVKETSGTAILDERTCALAREHGRYDPATDRRGRPISGVATIPVRWQIPGQPTASLDLAEAGGKRSMTVEAYYAATGLMTACKVVDVRPDDAKAAAAACPQKMIGSQGAVVTRGGKPVAYKVVRQSSLEIVASE